MGEKAEQKEQIAKAYEEYAQGFTPKPRYAINCIKAFLVGGSICCVAAYLQNLIMSAGNGMDKEAAGTFVTMILICTAQILTGVGIFDKIAKYCGAGVIVPITGFANSMVAPAMDYKREGLILGVGGKLFSIAGPVLVSGIVSATVVGIIYWILGII